MFDVLASFGKSVAETSLLWYSTVPSSHAALAGVLDCKNPVLVLRIGRSEVDGEEDTLYAGQIRGSGPVLVKNVLQDLLVVCRTLLCQRHPLL